MTQNIANFALIPFNFHQLEALNQETQDLEATLLYAMLKFQVNHTKLKKNNLQVIARSREQIASFLNLSLTTLDRLIKRLERLDLINKSVGTWYRLKRLFISTDISNKEINVNFKKLQFLTQYTGGHHASLLFARIAFGLNATQILHDGLSWFTMTRQGMASLLCVSLRTVDKIVSDLKKRGLIVAKHFVHHEKRQLHFTIPAEQKELLTKTYIEQAGFDEKAVQGSEKEQGSQVKPNGQSQNYCANTHFCREEPAKKAISIRVNDHIQDNNITLGSTNLKNTGSSSQCEITLNEIQEELNSRQERYLKAAIENTLQRADLNLSNPQELMEQVKFSILNPQQRKGINSFTHAVSRCMKLLRERNWKTPYGFNKHSAYGVEIKAYRDEQLGLHEEFKAQERGTDRLKQLVSATENGLIETKYPETAPFLPNLDSPKYNENFTLIALNDANEAKKLSISLKEDGKNESFVQKIDKLLERIKNFIILGADGERISACLPEELRA